MKVSNIEQGVPSWAELSTNDEEDAVAFYASLFGWSDDAQPLPPEAGGGSYHMEQIEGDNVAAISGQQPQEAQMGIPPHWNVYIAVNDVDVVSGKVTGAGGQVVMPPMDVMDAGRMAMIADPTGAVLRLWQAGRHEGFQRVREHGAVTWAELITDDPTPASKFLAAVLDVPAEEAPNPGDAEESYTLIDPAQSRMAGVLKKTPEMAGAPNAWAVYFEVDDTDAIVERAKKLGGSVVVEAFDLPTIGRISWLMDRQGAPFGVVKSEPQENQDGI